jgi:hypothetical protein
MRGSQVVALAVSVVACSSSNWAAGVDLVLLTTTLLVAGSAVSAVDDPATMTREDADGDKAAIVFLAQSLADCAGGRAHDWRGDGGNGGTRSNEWHFGA